MKPYIVGASEYFDFKMIIICAIIGIGAGVLPGVLGGDRLYVAAVVGICIFGALLVYRHSWAEILNIFLLSAVKFEPAPADLLFLLLFVTGVLRRRFDFGRLKDLGAAIWLPMSYMILGTLQLFTAYDKSVGIRYHLITIYLIIFCFYIFLYVNKKNVRSIIIAYIAASTLSTLLGLLGYGGLFPSIFMYDQYRIMGFFKDPNVLGPFLIPTVIITLDDIWKRRLISNHNAWIHIAIISINLLGVVATFSRGAWINIFVCFLIYGILNIRRIPFDKINFKKVAIYTVSVILAISIVWGFLIKEEYKEFLYARISLQSYDKGRFATHERGIDLAFENVSGYGPGQFEYNVLTRTGTTFSAHNLFIRLLMENGIIGFVIFLVGIGLVMYRLVINYRQGRSYHAFTPASMLAILSGILINSLVIDTLHWRHFWFFIGLSISGSVLVEKEKSEEVSPDKLELADSSQLPIQCFKGEHEVNVKVLTNWNQITLYKDIWKGILEDNGHDMVYLTFEWLYSWWEYHGSGNELYVLVVIQGEEILGFCPLMGIPARGYEHIRLIGGNEAGYMGFIIRDKFRREAIVYILDFLMGLKKRALISIHGISEDTEEYEEIKRYMDKTGCNYLETRVDSYYTNLENRNFDSYLKSRFGRRSIQTMKRKWNRLGKLGTISYKPFAGGEEELEAIFSIHDKRWQRKIGSAKFSHGQTREFFKGLVQSKGMPFKTSINTIDINGKIISFIYGFIYKGRYFYYRIGHDDDFGIFSPGEMVLRQRISECFDKGIRVFDFGPGYEPYKETWGMNKVHVASFTFPAKGWMVKAILKVGQWKWNIRQFLKKNAWIYKLVKRDLGKIKLYLYPGNRKKTCIYGYEWLKRKAIDVLTYIYQVNHSYIMYKELEQLNHGVNKTYTVEKVSVEKLDLLMEVTGLDPEDIHRRFIRGDRCLLVYTDLGINCLWLEIERIEFCRAGLSRTMYKNSVYIYEYFINRKDRGEDFNVLYSVLYSLKQDGFRGCYLIVRKKHNRLMQALAGRGFQEFRRLRFVKKFGRVSCDELEGNME